MSEVTKSWQSIVQTAEQEWPRWRGSAEPSSFPGTDREALQVEARHLRPLDFADSGPPGIVAQWN
jgi:hypothetical protein